jgi:DNA primase
MLQVAEIDFVARAPPGTEVEELTYKQIVKALRYKTPIEQYLGMRGMARELKELNEKTAQESQNGRHQKRGFEESKAAHEAKPTPSVTREQPAKQETIEEPEQETVEIQEEAPEAAIEEAPNDLRNPKYIEQKGNELLKEKMTEVYDANGEVIGSFSLAETFDKIPGMEKAETVITGGVISQRLVDVCYKIGVKNIYGAKLGNITKKPTEIRVISWERHQAT